METKSRNTRSGSMLKINSLLITTKKIGLIVSIMFLLSGLSKSVYGQFSPDIQKKLWAELVELYRNPVKKNHDRANIIDGIELVRKVDGVSEKAAALASIIKYYNKSDRVVRDDGTIAGVLRDLAANKKLTDKEMEKLQKNYQEHNNTLRKEYEDADREISTTQGVSISKLLDAYLKKNGNDIKLALNKFAANRGYSINYINKSGYNYQEAMGLIDKKMPLLFMPTDSDNYFVVVGYLKNAQGEYLLIADPRATKFKEVSHASLILGKGDWAKEAREKSKELDKQFGMAKKDYKLIISDELADGLSFVDFKQKGAIYIVSDFIVSEAAIEKLYFKSFIEKLFKR